MRKILFLMAVVLLPVMYSCEKNEFDMIAENICENPGYWTDENNTVLLRLSGSSSWNVFFYCQGRTGFFSGVMLDGEGSDHWTISGPKANLTIYDVYSEDEMKVSFAYQAFNETEPSVVFSPAKIHRVKVEQCDDDIRTVAWRGYKGELRDEYLSTDANAVTADGFSQLAIILDDPSQELIKLSPFATRGCKFDEAKYSSDKGHWSVKYTAPNSCTSNGESSSVILLGVVKDNNGEASFRMYEEGLEISVYKMGVGLVHGLWSSAKACFGGLQEHLLSQGYQEEQVNMIDYHDTNGAAFKVNVAKEVVGDSLECMYNNLLRKGIVSSRYALVGHSMGGILSRLYAQGQKREGVGAIITLDTPHWGSHIADLGGNIVSKVQEAVDEYVEKAVVGVTANPLLARAAGKVISSFLEYIYEQTAISDLRSDSQATLDMNSISSTSNLNNIPVHAICSYMDGYGAVETPDKKTLVDELPILKYSETMVFFSRLEKEVYNMYQAGSGDVSQLICNLIFEESEHDGVVSGTSQRGGLEEKYCTIERDAYKGLLGFKSNAHHCMTNKWDLTYSNIYSLLGNPANDPRFCTTWFKTRSTSRTAESGSDYEYTFVENANTYIKFKTCALEEVDDTHCIHLELEKSENIIADMVIVSFGEEKFNVDICRDSYYLEIPEDYMGEAEICICGKTENNELVVNYQALTIN